MLYGLNDICIIPTIVSDISSRSECNPYSSGEMLPLFTAPMSCIIDEHNWETFVNNGIFTIIPRNININKRIALCDTTFVALSLDEFEEWFINKGKQTHGCKLFICIDIANGHMKKLLNLCKTAKEIQGDDLILMTGNIANPETYLEYAKAGIDYVRIGIGSGNVCTTSANGGIHYPMASLIQACKEHQDICIRFKIHPNNCDSIKSIPKIIADGGFKNFDQIIKALALGADYCMLGEIFAKSWEACEPAYRRRDKVFNLHKEDDLWCWKTNYNSFTAHDFPAIHRDYYGMSTKRAQEEFGNTKLKTAEGIIKQVRVDYTLSQWTENFIHYLKSAMSYTGSKTLQEFQHVKTEIISPHAFNSYYK